MSKTKIPQKVQSALWARAGGRCQYRGCNNDLVGDLVAGREDGTYGFIAHIIADTPTGPRGHELTSVQLSKSLKNLMLMCARHHKLIDVDAVDDHPEFLLLSMKAEHERRIAVVTGIDEERASHVLRFGARIGANEALVSTQAIFAAMLPEHHPAQGQTVDLDMTGCAFRDDEPEYWTFQRENLRRQFEAKVSGRIERQEIKHLSVFALAPQPLLIELGRLLGEIVPASVHQRHREPTTWAWQKNQPPIVFKVQEPASILDGPVALKLAVSANVIDDRIHAVLGKRASIWSLSAENPHNDILRRPQDQAIFRKLLRHLYDQIKLRHGEHTELNVFPVLPASLAIEVGRAWMPKADLALRVFDNHQGQGFIRALDLPA